MSSNTLLKFVMSLVSNGVHMLPIVEILLLMTELAWLAKFVLYFLSATKWKKSKFRQEIWPFALIFIKEVKNKFSVTNPFNKKTIRD